MQIKKNPGGQRMVRGELVQSMSRREEGVMERKTDVQVGLLVDR